MDDASLTSPGAALALRQDGELRLAATARRLFAGFLAGVLADARAAVAGGVLLAAARPDPFTAAKASARWEALSSDLARAAATLAGVTGPETMTDAYLSRVKDRLVRAPLSALVYDSTAEVLRAATDGAWSRRRTEAALREVLQAGTASVQRAVGDGEGGGTLEESGPVWLSSLERIARTEATAAFGYRQLQTLASEGYRLKRWVARRDTRTRATHAAADGQVVPIVQEFGVGGQMLMFPADPAATLAETANCRCVMIGLAQSRRGRRESRR